MYKTLKQSMVDKEDEYAQGFDEHFEPAVSDTHECPICLLVLNNPMQTDCGHRFCKGCILRVVRDGRPCCPIDNSPLEEHMLHPDNYARREILQLNVRCRNYTEQQCPWIGPLKELEKHVKDCIYTSEECPLKCGEPSLLKKDIPQHIESVCRKRIVPCKFCDVKLVFSKVYEHLEHCTMIVVRCPNGCLQPDIKRNELTHHIDYECQKTMKKCPFRECGCKFEGAPHDLNEHAKIEVPHHMTLMLKENNYLKQEINTLHTELNNERERNEKAMSREENNTPAHSLNEVVRKINDLERNMLQARNTLDSQWSETLNKRKETEGLVDELRRQVNKNSNLISEVNARVWHGTFIWKIVGFESLFQQARTGQVPALHSIPFYSGIPGYRMCLRLNLNGIASGLNTHVSMFLHLMQGDYDSVVPWPFSGSLIFKVMQQDATGEPKHVVETLSSRPSLQAFLRPNTTRNNKGYGYVEMIAHDLLYRGGYLKNDTIIVSVEVNT